jgi:hypothetical protein
MGQHRVNSYQLAVTSWSANFSASVYGERAPVSIGEVEPSQITVHPEGIALLRELTVFQ